MAGKDVEIAPGFWLDEDAATAFKSALIAAEEDKGVKPERFTSGYRDSAEQAKLWARYKAGQGPQAARPGTSTHEKGLSGDLGFKNDGERDRFASAAEPYGLKRDVQGEPWHFTYQAKEGVAPTMRFSEKEGSTVTGNPKRAWADLLMEEDNDPTSPVASRQDFTEDELLRMGLGITEGHTEDAPAQEPSASPVGAALAAVTGQAKRPAPVQPIEDFEMSPQMVEEDRAPIPQYTPPKPKDFTGDLARAQDDERANRLQAALAHAGATITGAFTGKPNYAFSQGLAKDAASPVDAVGQNREIDSLAVKAQEANDRRNPESLFNVNARKRFAGMFPEIADAMGPAFESLTDDKINELMGHKRAEQGRELSLLKHRTPSATAELIQDGVKERHGENKVQKLGESMAKFSDTVSIFNQMEEIAPGLTVGVVPAALSEKQRMLTEAPTLLGRRFADPEALKLSQMAHLLRNNARHDTAGANLTDAEIADWERIFDMSIIAGAPAQAMAIAMFRKRIADKLAAMKAPYKPERVQEYESHPGAVKLTPPPTPQAPEQKHEVSRLYYPKVNKTLIKFSDGTEEAIDGR